VIAALLGASVLYHAVHYGLVFVVPSVVLLIVAFSDRRRPRAADTQADDERREARMRQAFGVGPPLAAVRRAPDDAAVPQQVDLPRAILATLSGGAGLIHAGVISLHLKESSLYGAFFILASIAQVSWAFVLLRAPSRKLLVYGIVGNAAVIALWAVSRSTGLPIGPEPGIAERIGWADTIASVYEAALVVFGSVMLFGRAPKKNEVPRFHAEVIVVLLLVGAGVAAIWGHRAA
jgi:hypothetical protein